jgi:hypothetical protein
MQREMEDTSMAWSEEGRRVQKGSCSVCGRELTKTLF